VHHQQDQQNDPQPSNTRLIGGCLLVLLILIGIFALLWAALDVASERLGF